MKTFISVTCGSYNPPHIGHLRAFDDILKEREKLHVFVRYNEGVELVSREIKEKWFERISAERDNRLIVHFFTTEDLKGKVYDINTSLSYFPRFEAIIGEPIDEMWFGEDLRSNIEEAAKYFPNIAFRIMKRDGISSTAIRNDLEKNKDWLPAFVYEDIIANRAETK